MCRLLIALALFVIGVQCAPQLRPVPRQQPQQPFSLPNSIVAPQRKSPGFEQESVDYEMYQNQNAKYQFSSDIEDHINDLTNQRHEVRDGSAVKGSYSYSDGYYKITVKYVADDDGYRVTGMEAIPLSGPQVDLKGTASVRSTAHGAQLKYRVASVPVPEPEEKIANRHTQQFPSH